MTRCDACSEPAVMVALIARVTKAGKPQAPGQFRLCPFHSIVLADSDPTARQFPIDQESTR